MAETAPPSTTTELPAELAQLSPAPSPVLSTEIAGDQEEEIDIDALERQVREMGDRVHHFRSTLPEMFREELESSLAFQRPSFSVPEIGGRDESQIGDGANLGNDIVLRNKDSKIGEKIELLKTKIAHNVASIPIALKKVNECLLAADELESYDLNVHPSFKRRKFLDPSS